MKALTRREAIQKGGRIVMGAAAGAFSQTFASGCSNQELSQEIIAKIMEKAEKADIEDVKLTIVYDNIPYAKGMGKDWGFSCLVDGLDKTILFDAGRYDDIFMSNMSKLKIDPHQIDELVFSHDHPDHIGGVRKILEARPGISVTIVKSFGSGFKNSVRKQGADLTEIDQPQRVTNNCISTGEMKDFVRNEHSLIILTDKGLIILTGCAHPGVVEIVERAKTIANQEVLLVIGGFHLLMDYGSSLRKIAQRLKDLGVRYAAPSHCSGEEAMETFAEAFGGRFIESGVGRVITSRDLT